jgi:hypothetical protein
MKIWYGANKEKRIKSGERQQQKKWEGKMPPHRFL